jgi:plastocyanin
MALEDVPPGVASDGAGLVLFVETIADAAAPTAAELNAGDKITYSITGDGYSHDVTENRVTANRLTLKQSIQYAGTIEDTLEITYAATYTETDVARTLLPEGTAGYIVERWGVPNEDPVATGDLVTVIPVKAGVQRSNAPVTNQELTITQSLLVTGTVHRLVAVAGA